MLTFENKYDEVVKEMAREVNYHYLKVSGFTHYFIKKIVKLFEETDNIWNECNWERIVERDERMSEIISEIKVEIRELKKAGK